MTLKDVMDPITWFEYASDRRRRGLPVEDDERTTIEVPKTKEPDYKKILDPIQYFEYMSEKQGGKWQPL